ncbi:MAG: ComEC/Rec2 family competence protein, partial [Bacteroidales bacterium]
YSGYLIHLNDSTQAKPSSPIPVLLYFSKDSTRKLPNTGDHIIGQIQLRRIKNNGNPFEFDFEKYMRHKGILYSAYINSYHTVFFTTNYENHFEKILGTIFQKSNQLRNRISDWLQLHVSSERNRAFLSAIIIGDKTGITQEIRSDFSMSGLSHILAVSGLHTGIIFCLLMVLLFPIRLFGIRPLLYLIIIIIMWGYAMLTGFSASVNRAVSMITILLVSRIIHQDNNPLNSLFITAFILLGINPYYLFDPGFQLSFLAVLSILIFYPLYQKAIPKKFTLLNPALKIVSVTLAAQMLTLPLSIFYFHTFPLWLIPANLLILPLLPLLLFISICGIICTLLGINQSLLTNIMNEGADLIFSISTFFAEITSEIRFYPEKEETFLIFFFISTLIVYLHSRKLKWLSINLVVIATFLSLQFIKTNNQSNTEIVFFNRQTSDKLCFIQDKECFIYDPDTTKKLNYTPEEELIKRKRIERITLLRHDTLMRNGIFTKAPFVQIADKKFCIITGNQFRRKYSSYLPEIDYMIIGSKFTDKPENLLKIARFSKLILLPSLSSYQRKRSIAFADSLNIPSYDIRKEGAFRLKTNTFKNQYLSEH